MGVRILGNPVFPTKRYELRHGAGYVNEAGRRGDTREEENVKETGVKMRSKQRVNPGGGKGGI